MTRDMRQLDYAELRTIMGEQPYRLLFATVSGAHLYGFPSRDSDVDLRGVHVLPAAEVVGLRTGPETLDRTWFENEAEVDLVTHDLAKFARLMLRRNGYVLEQVLSPLVVVSTPEHEELVALAKDCVTRWARPSLPRIREHAMGLLREEAGVEAAALHLPGPAHRDQPDADRRRTG